MIIINLVRIIMYKLFLILMIIKIAKKRDYHIDEIFSYGLSNQHAHLALEEGQYESPIKLFNNYLTVNKNSRFNFSRVWENQAKDIHPPFYYILLHSICSLFPGKFSRWYAGSINIFFALLSLYTLRKLVLNLTNNNEEINYIVSLLFIFSPRILSLISFFRMYIGSMYFITLITYIIIKEIDTFESTINFYLKLYCVSLLGALMHYYCMFFTIFICFNYAIFLLTKRKFKEIIKLIITGILSGTSACLIFPGIIYHFFYDYRSIESLNYLQSSVNEFFNRIKIFYAIINIDLFGGRFFQIIICIIILLVMNFILLKSKKIDEENNIYNRKNNIIKYGIIFISILMYFLFISKVVIYKTSRYMIPIYCITFTGFISLMILLIMEVIKKKTIYYPLIILILALIYKKNWEILSKESLNFPKITNPLQNYSNIDCIFIYKLIQHTTPFTFEMKNCKRIKFIREQNINSTIFLSENNNTKVILIIHKSIDIRIKDFLKYFPKINSYKEIRIRNELKIYLLESK